MKAPGIDPGTWKSWDLLEPGFVRELREKGGSRVREVQLLQLKVGVPLGACYVGADAAGVVLKKNYTSNTDRFFHKVI